MRPLSLPVQTLYAELLEQLLTLDAQRTIGRAPGSFVTKTLEGGTYYYFQYSEPGGGKRQAYVGRKSSALEALARRYAEERALVLADERTIAGLCAALRAGGATMTDARSARVLGALAAAGVFRLGAVLVGTHAFLVLGNVLGVRWEGAASRTADVDLAAHRRLEVAVPELASDVPAVLEGLDLGLLPVPSLSTRGASTSFQVRGQGLRVDLVTPARGSDEGPVAIPRLNAAAAPVRFLDYLMEDPQPAAVVDGGGVLVIVPQPARFAVHKLLVAQDRPAAMQAKARKDVAQAARLVLALEELRPGDLRVAALGARNRGSRWAAALRKGCALLEREDAAAARILTKSVR